MKQSPKVEGVGDEGEHQYRQNNPESITGIPWFSLLHIDTLNMVYYTTTIMLSANMFHTNIVRFYAWAML